MKRKRIINVILSISTALSFILVTPLTINAANQNNTNQENTSIELTKNKLDNTYKQEGYYLLDTGNYILKEDIEINIPIKTKDNSIVSIDLNGKVICQNGDYSAIIVGDGSIVGQSRYTIFTTIDTNPNNKHYFEITSEGLWKWNKDLTDSQYYVSGGIITNTSNNVSYGAGIYSTGYSTLNIEGGNIVGCKAGNGAGTYVNEKDSLIMKNSSIRGCLASSNGGGIFINGRARVTMNENSLIGNCQSNQGGGIYMSGNSCNFKLNGGTITRCTASELGCALRSDASSNDSDIINIIKGLIDSCTLDCLDCNKNDISIGSNNTIYVYGGTINASVSTDSKIICNNDEYDGYQAGMFTTFNGKVTSSGEIEYGIFYKEPNLTDTGKITGKKLIFKGDVAGTNIYATEIVNDESITTKPIEPTKTGYKFLGWYEKDANGRLKANSFEFGNALTNDITLYAKWLSLTSSSEIIEGNNQSFKLDEIKDLSFRSNDSYAYFQKVKVDGNEISEDNYTVREGSIIVTLKNSYLNTLSEGSHTISIVSLNGEATTNFTIIRDTNDENNPTLKPSTSDTTNSTTDKSNTSDKSNVKTGDNTNIVIWVVGLLISIVGIGYYKKDIIKF